MSNKQIIITKDEANQRLDHYLNSIISQSRSFIQKQIKDGSILVNDTKVKTGYILLVGDVITIGQITEETLDLTPVAMDLEIVYQDEDLLVINKPQGLVVHPASSYKEATLVHGLLHQIDDLSSINGVVRPGIIHRIDKDTSGLLLVAKSDVAHHKLAADLALHKIKREYYALVYGTFKESHGTIDAPIARHPKDRLKYAVSKEGKNAVTHFKVEQRYLNYTLLSCSLETGRTHQIRVHLNYINHPIVGDPIYGPKKVIGNSGQFLHAYRLTFNHPIKNEQMTFTAALPTNFSDFINQL